MTQAMVGLSLLMVAMLSAPPNTRALDGTRTLAAAQQATLTQAQPEARIEIPPEKLTSPPALIEVPIRSTKNPAQTPFSIFVYLTWRGTPPDLIAPQKILLGTFSVFPADRPGTYVVRASEGFRRLEAVGVNPTREPMAVILEMRRVSEEKAWTAIEVTVAPLRCRGTFKE